MSKDFSDIFEHHGYVNAVLYFAEHWCEGCPYSSNCLYMDDCYFFTKWTGDVFRMKDLLKEKEDCRTLFDVWE